MPEMPEVENIVRGIRPFIETKKITDIEIIKSDIVKYPSVEQYVQRIKNSRINAVKRRGKYIILELDNGIAAVIHLRMTGKLLYTRQNQPIDKYACVIFTLEDKNKLVYADVRRLGTLDAVTNRELPRLKGLYSLGAEPLTADFSVDYVAAVEKELESALGRKISIQQGKNSGQLTLEYYGADDLERLIDALRGLRV